MVVITEYRYELDVNDQIVDVSPSWLAFARNNEAEELSRDHVWGRSVFQFIAGWKLSELYQQLFTSIRASGRPVSLPFRCDSARVKRFMELQLSPYPNGHIECSGRLLRRERHRAIPLLDRHAKRNDQYLVICSVCRLLRLADTDWREIEAVLPDPYGVPTEGLPLLSHDVCPKCTTVLQNLARD